MEGQPPNIENFDQFYEYIKRLVDENAPKEQIESEADNWLRTRYEETNKEGVLPSKRLEFQIQWARVCIALYRPEEKIHDLVNDMLQYARHELSGLENRLKLITETPSKYIEWYLKLENGAVAGDEDSQRIFIEERIALIKSEIETINGLIQRTLDL